jgi:hypothetical protein
MNKYEVNDLANALHRCASVLYGKAEAAKNDAAQQRAREQAKLLFDISEALRAAEGAPGPHEPPIPPGRRMVA